MLPVPDPVSVRRGFAGATQFFVNAVLEVRDDQWDQPGLGEWTVRELAGHTLRALTTVERYLAAPTLGGAGTATSGGIGVESTVDYFRAVLAGPGVHAGVADRGREAGAELTDPAATVSHVARRVLALVAATPDDTVCATPAGGMRLVDYLPTRCVELVVHTLDLLRATGQDWTVEAEVFDVPLGVLVALATPSQLLLVLAGRQPLPPAYNVLS